MQRGKLNVVLDGQWGSTGKGKLCYYLALKHDVRVAVCDFQTNAGHTIVTDGGQKYVFQQLPVSAIKRDVLCLINPAATITVEQILKEIEMADAGERVHIHPHACVVTQDCKDMEAATLKRIASTLKGCGAATGMKAMRHPKTVLAKDEPRLARWVADTTEILHRALYRGAMVLGEGAQGFDLSLNHGFDYPYVTSRDVTTASFLSNAGVPPRLLGTVYGCLRTYPIRVGNHVENGVTVGSSGPYYGDQQEITWADLQKASGANFDLVERTTVTQKVRRVFTFSKKQVERFVRVCAPDEIFLNFVNHIDAFAGGAQTVAGLPESVLGYVDDLDHFLRDVAHDAWGRVETIKPPRVTYLGTGAKNNEMVELEGN